MLQEMRNNDISDPRSILHAELISHHCDQCVLLLATTTWTFKIAIIRVQIYFLIEEDDSEVSLCKRRTQ